MAASLPGALSSTCSIVSPARCSISHLLRRQFRRAGPSAPAWPAPPPGRHTARPSAAGELAVTARPGPCPARAVISADSSAGTMPSLSVVHTRPSVRSSEAPALSSQPKPSEPSNRPSANHLKPTGTSYSRRPSRFATRSISGRADHGLAHRGVRAPLRPMAEQVVDQHRQIMVRLHQAAAAGDDAVAVVVGVAGEGDVVAVLQADQRAASRTSRTDPCGSCRPSPPS